MKLSKRYIVLSILLVIVFLLKFHIMQMDVSQIGTFRGGNLSANAWYPLIANDVNGKVLKVVIDNKEYTNE